MSQLNPLEEEFRDIDKLPYPLEAKNDLKAFVVIEYLKGYEAGTRAGTAYVLDILRQEVRTGAAVTDRVA